MKNWEQKPAELFHKKSSNSDKKLSRKTNNLKKSINKKLLIKNLLAQMGVLKKKSTPYKWDLE